MPRDLSRRMLEATEKSPLIDLHERLLPEPRRVEQRLDFLSWFLAYAGQEVRSLRSTRALQLDDEALALLADVNAPPERRWSVMEQCWPHIRTTATGRVVLRMAWELFGVEDVEQHSWKELSAKLWKTAEKGFYRRLLRQKANVIVTLVDNKVPAGARPLCLPIANADPLIAPRCRDDVESLPGGRDAEKEATERLDRIAERFVHSNVDGGCVAFKVSLLPEVELPGDEEVGWALGRVLRSDDPDTPLEPALHGYLLDRLLTYVGKVGLPVQVHMRNATMSARLEGWAGRHRQVRFVAVCADGADPFSLLSLSRSVPNVSLAMGDLWRTAPYLAGQALRAWIQGVPLAKIHAWAGDATMVEAVCAQALIVRERVADVLASMVADGDLDEPDAYRVIEETFIQNARRDLALDHIKP